MDNPFTGLRAGATAGALSAGLAAWRAGQDIHDAISAAGYARDYAEYVISYISQDPTGASEAADSMSPKRVKVSSSTTTTTKRKQAPVAPNVKKYVNKCMNKVIEKKYLFVDASRTNIATTGNVDASYLCLITAGTGDANRTGNQIWVTGVQLKGWFSDTSQGIGRLLIGWDRQSNGAAPGVGDVLQTTDINSLYNADTVVGSGGARFTILHDSRHNIEPQVAGQANVKFVSFADWTTKKNVQYDATAGTVSDMQSNNLFLLFISNSATIDFTGRIKVRFQDV